MAKASDSVIRDLMADGTLVAIKPVGRELQATRVDNGEDVTHLIKRWVRTKASKADSGLRLKYTKTGGIQWRQVPNSEIDAEMRINSPRHTSAPSVAMTKTVPASTESGWTPMEHDDMKEFINRALEYKPADLEIDELKWKYVIRTALRGKNLLFVGPSGCGKTLACQSLGKVFDSRPWFVFNLGATQDPRGYLIGNTHYNSEKGTFFADSLFVQAIQTPGAVILLDEMSRAHDDASNILMSVLDENQRYLRIDEKPDTPTVPVAPGVVFLSTANIGNEYTGARVMDRALLDRFIIIEMEPLSKEKETELLKSKYPSVDEKLIEAIAEIASHTRDEMRSEDPKVSTLISTRMTVEMSGLIHDGFTLADAAEVCVYPFFTPAGGADSERTYMKQVVQKWLPTEFDEKETPWDGDGDAENKVPW